jgi:hypothetical protein
VGGQDPLVATFHFALVNQPFIRKTEQLI